jgi:hypothetical protein
MAQASLWILAFLGVFYAVLAVSFIRRSRKHSCRICLYWQQCLAKDLISGSRGQRCAWAQTRS